MASSSCPSASSALALTESERPSVSEPPKLDRRKLAVHQRYFCGPNAEKTKKQQIPDSTKRLNVRLQGCRDSRCAQRLLYELRKTAAKKAMQSMGIGNSSSSSSKEAPPTITNIYRSVHGELAEHLWACGHVP